MKIRVLAEKEVSELSNTTQGSVTAAKRIWPSLKVDYITTRHIGFTVKDPKYNTSHSVLYLSEKKFEDAWRCDCMWYSLRGQYCKHILGIFFRMRNDPDFLKRFRDSIVDYKRN